MHAKETSCHEEKTTKTKNINHILVTRTHLLFLVSNQSGKREQERREKRHVDQFTSKHFRASTLINT